MSDETVKAMAAFVRWTMEAAWEGGSLDGGELQDKAEILGLIVHPPERPDWFVYSPGVTAIIRDSITEGLPKD